MHRSYRAIPIYLILCFRKVLVLLHAIHRFVMQSIMNSVATLRHIQSPQHLVAIVNNVAVIPLRQRIRKLSRPQQVLLLVGVLFLLYSAITWTFPKSRRVGIRNRNVDMFDDHFSGILADDDVSERRMNLLHTGRSSDTTQNFFPIAGNGYFLLVDEDKPDVLIRQERTLSLPVGFNPLVKADVVTNLQAATHRYRTLHVEKGRLSDYWFYAKSSDIATVERTTIAHRNWSHLLIQTLDFKNPTNSALEVMMSSDSHSAEWSTFDLADDLKKSSAEGSAKMYQRVIRKEKSHYLVTIASNAVTYQSPTMPTIAVPPGEGKTVNIFTMIEYSVFKAAPTANETAMARSFVSDQMVRVLAADMRKTVQQHESAWKAIMRSGFEVATSRAPHALNGHSINATFYYILSNVPTEHQLRNDKHFNAYSSGSRLCSRFVDKPTSCYDGHTSTLAARSLWHQLDYVEGNHPDSVDRERGSDDVPPILSQPLDESMAHAATKAGVAGAVISTTRDFIAFCHRWMVTLETAGCCPQLREGVEGVVQAMTLSLGKLRFRFGHLELGIQPEEMPRSIMVRLLSLDHAFSKASDKKGWVSLYLDMDESDRPTIAIQLTHDDNISGDDAREQSGHEPASHHGLWVCDAGCHDEPVMVKPNVSPIKIPFLVTRPFHPILYMSPAKEHLDELRHSLHYDSIQPAQAHDTDVLLIHKIGHHRDSGLPASFWVVLVAVIALFHVYLIKLIVVELRNSNAAMRNGGHAAPTYSRLRNKTATSPVPGGPSSFKFYDSQ